MSRDRPAVAGGGRLELGLLHRLAPRPRRNRGRRARSTFTWTTLPCLVDAQLRPDGALDPQALRLRRVVLLAARARRSAPRASRCRFGDRHEPPVAVARRRLRLLDARAAAWSSACCRPVPRPTNRPRWSRSATRRSRAAVRPSWRGSSLGGGGVGGGGVGPACDGRSAACGSRRRLDLGRGRRLHLGRRQLLLDVDLDRLVGVEPPGSMSRPRAPAAPCSRPRRGRASGARAAADAAPTGPEVFLRVPPRRYLPGWFVVLIANWWTPERLTRSITCTTSP